MPENPYQPPKERPEPSGWQWPSVELVLAYALGIPLVAVLVLLALGAWFITGIPD